MLVALRLLHGVLHLSEHAAYGRIEAARTGRRIPIVLEMLERGELTLTSIGLLAPHLTIDNHAEVLARATHRTRREVEELVASLRPKPDAPEMVRRIPQPQVQLPADAREPEPGTTALSAARVETPSPPPIAPAPQPAVTPLAPERYRIEFTADRQSVDLLERARALMRHTNPDGDLATIFRRALGSLVADLEKGRFAATSRPRTSGPAVPSGRRIPAAVRREVWKRDDGRCAFVGASGRCAESGFLEFHHLRPFFAGGPSTTGNLELRCRAHNRYESEQLSDPPSPGRTGRRSMCTRSEPSGRVAAGSPLRRLV